MRKFIAMALCLSGAPVLAQTDRIDSLLNDLIYSDQGPALVPEKPVTFDFIYTGSYYNNNTFYAGRELGTDRYNISGNLYYYSTTGIFAGISGIWFDQLTPGYNRTILSAGYSKAVGSQRSFVLRTSYSRFVYYKPDTGITYPYSNNINLGLSFRKRWLGARINGNLLFGESSAITVSSGLYGRFTLIRLGKYNKLYSVPEISVIFGPETVETIKSGILGSQSSGSLKEVYSLLNTMLYVPVGISYGSFDFEAGYTINFPSTQDVTLSYPVRSYFSASIGYMIPIQKK